MLDNITAREISGDLQAIAGIGQKINSWNSAQNAGQKLGQIADIAAIAAGGAV